MKTRSANAAPKSLRLPWAIALVMLAISTIAHADALVNKNVMVTTASIPLVESLGLSSAGTLSIAVSDLGWPQVLESLSFAISDGTSVLKSLGTAGSLSYDVTGPMTLFANIYGVASASAGSGLYHVNVSFAPAVVPLPAAVWLLLSGIGFISELRRSSRRKGHSVTGSMAH